jgi:hypothetical protein
MQELDPDLPWIHYRYLTSDRMRRFTGRNHVEMTCKICGARELRSMRIPRFRAVPTPVGGQHIARVEFKLVHLHKEQPDQTMWVQPYSAEPLRIPTADRVDEIEDGLFGIVAAQKLEAFE